MKPRTPSARVPKCHNPAATRHTVPGSFPSLLIRGTLLQQYLQFLLVHHFPTELSAENIFPPPSCKLPQLTVSKFYSFFKMVAPLNLPRLHTLLSFSTQVELWSVLVLSVSTSMGGLSPCSYVYITPCSSFVNLSLL